MICTLIREQVQITNSMNSKDIGNASSGGGPTPIEAGRSIKPRAHKRSDIKTARLKDVRHQPIRQEHRGECENSPGDQNRHQADGPSQDHRRPQLMTRLRPKAGEDHCDGG
jgi:hypothetical protein